MDFPFVRAWVALGAPLSDVDKMLARARKGDEDQNVCFWSEGALRWVTIEEIHSSYVRRRLLRWAADQGCNVAQYVRDAEDLEAVAQHARERNEDAGR